MKITFILQDSFWHSMAVQHENRSAEIKTRTATIELTPEQLAVCGRRKTGELGHGVSVLEDIIKVYVESEAFDAKP